MSKQSERVISWRNRTKERIIQSFGGSCGICGYKKCQRSLDLHHLDPNEKDFSLSSIRARPKSWDSIVKELRKCVLVCHNCHSEIHAGVRQLSKTYAKFNNDYTDWRKIEEYDSCPICNKEKPVKQKFCSHSCAQTNSRKVDWDNIDLLALLKTHKISELEEKLGVSNAAIYKRRDKILGKNTERGQDGNAADC